MCFNFEGLEQVISLDLMFVWTSYNDISPGAATKEPREHAPTTSVGT